MLEKIFIGVGAVIVLFLVIAATRQSAYHVERKLEVAAKADAVFAILSDVDRFADVFILFGEPIGKDPKKQTMTIAESVPGEKVVIKLEIFEPMKSTSTITLVLMSTKTGTLVAWSTDGQHNFLGKALTVFMNTDKMLGGDIEKSLAALKSAAEKQR